MPHPFQRMQRAFTLIELLCVISLMTVMVSMTLPMISKEKSITAVSYQIADVLAAARATAVAKNVYVYVGFAQDGQDTVVYSATSKSGEADISTTTTMGKPLVMPNIVLCDPGELQGKVTFTGVSTSADAISDSDLGTFPTTYHGTKLQCAKVIQFSPSGAVSVRAAWASRYIQFGLEPVRPAQSKNVSLIQIAGVTGAISVFMP